MLDHKHLIITAKVEFPPKDPEYIKAWTTRLIKSIGMNTLLGPYAVYSDMVGNRGLTCIAAIDTSSISIHCWDEESPGTIQMDIYSCKDFDIEIAFQALRLFQVVSMDHYFLDRNGDKITKIQTENLISKFKRGDTVRKTKGSEWHGTVVGTYSSTLTSEGYAVESWTERGSVQIYPASALELWKPTGVFSKGIDDG